MIMIREAVIQDAEYTAEISTDSLGYTCRSTLVAKRLEELNGNKQKVFAAVGNNIAAGFVHAELYQEDSINVSGLAVSRNSQGKGCGKQDRGSLFL